MSIMANFPFELGRTSLPKVQIKRVCKAAFDRLQQDASTEVS